MAQRWRDARTGVALGAALALAPGGRAAADERAAAPIAFVGESRCPTPEAVRTALAPLLPARAARARVTLEDDGDLHRVFVDGAERRFDDRSRDCARRAQVIAVHLALVLALPDEPDDARGGPPTPRAEPIVAIELAALGVAPPAGGGVAPGLAVRASSPRAFTWALGVGASLPARLPIDEGQARILRATVDLSVRAAGGAARQLSVELGPLLAAQRITADGAAGAPMGFRWQPGGRLAVAHAWGASRRVRVVLGVEIQATPIASDMLLAPYGVVGATPRLWLGARLGALWEGG